MSILKRTVGELIDMLVTTNLKIWFAIEEETKAGISDAERGVAGMKVLKLNKKRHAIISAINQTLGIDFYEDEKTY